MQPDQTIEVDNSPQNAGFFVTAYPHLADMMFGRPIMIHQPAMDAVLHALAPRMGYTVPAASGKTMTAQERPSLAVMANQRGHYADAGYYVMNNGTAIVPITGKIANRVGWMDAASGMTSYSSVESMLSAALSDPDVSRVVLEIDSPGGTVAGAFDFADRVHASRGAKPIIAAPSEMAASAAYLIASAADEIVLPQTAAVGSVGIVVALLNRQKAMEKAGLAMTFIFAGDKKVDGNPFEALSDRVRAEIQAEVDSTYDLFVGRVAKYRGMTADAVRGTQAAMFTGTKAVDVGFADRVDSFANVISSPRRAAATPGSRSSLASQSQETSMTDAEKAAADKAHADALASARAEARAAGIKEGAAAERSRIEAILTHAEAEARTSSAAHLAFKTDMAAADATALLSTMPKAAAAKPEAPAGSALERAMAATGGSAKVGMDADGDTTTHQSADSVWDAVIKSR